MIFEKYISSKFYTQKVVKKLITVERFDTLKGWVYRVFEVSKSGKTLREYLITGEKVDKDIAYKCHLSNKQIILTK